MRDRIGGAPLGSNASVDRRIHGGAVGGGQPMEFGHRHYGLPLGMCPGSNAQVIVPLLPVLD